MNPTYRQRSPWQQSQQRTIIAATFIFLGLAAWITALWLPAIRTRSIGSGFETIDTGFECFFNTVHPMNWLFDPLTLGFFFTNIALWLSPMALFKVRSAIYLLAANIAATLYSLTAVNLGTLLPGFFVWGASFLLASCGLVLLVPLASTGWMLRYECPRCGYDLRGQEGVGCPECGWNRRESEPRE